MNKIKKPVVGDWYTFCCELELKQITSVAELQDVIESLDDDMPATIWHSREEALKNLDAVIQNYNIRMQKQAVLEAKLCLTPGQ